LKFFFFFFKFLILAYLGDNFQRTFFNIKKIILRGLKKNHLHYDTIEDPRLHEEVQAQMS
jgi:hypothetical protein